MFQTFDRGPTYAWSLTGHTVSWDGSAYQFYVSSGGGGCVAKNTEILLADGRHTKKVQSLKVGDWILGYNTSSGETVQVKVTNVTESVVPSLLSINEGLLKTTVVDQPIYMRNETYKNHRIIVGGVEMILEHHSFTHCDRRRKLDFRVRLWDQ